MINLKNNPQDTLNVTDLQQKLTEAEKQAEFHAYSVRQLHARHDRIMAALSLMATHRIDHEGLSRIVTAIQTTPSQFHQDVFALIFSGAKHDGFFVEFGACDGKLTSNTLTLETLGWRGILAEPLPSWHNALKANRSCITDTRCVWSRSGEHLTLSEMAGDQYATEASVTPGMRATTASHEVASVSLDDLLREYNAPRLIDFLSMDTEGSELEILNAFSFGYRFGFLAIEAVNAAESGLSQIERLMNDNGYQRTLHNLSGYDHFYVPINPSST
jgi:FkbM family methyltransferase